MAGIKIGARQIRSRDLLDQLKNAADTELDDLLRSIDSELTPPFRLDASSPADLAVSVGASLISNSENNRQKSAAHVGGVLPSFTSGTITFPASSGGTVTISPGTNVTLTVTSNYYIKCIVYIDANEDLGIIFGVEDTVEADATVPKAPSGTTPIGYITLFNNAGTIDNIAQNKIYQFGAGAGGGDGSGTGVGEIPADGFNEVIIDSFEALLSSSDSLVAATNGERKGVENPLIELSLDKGKTFSTTGTACTISGAPSFTIAADDIIYDNTSGEWRRIASISSQTSVTLDAAFTVDLSSNAGMVSQAVFIKDLINLGDATQKTRIRDFYSEDIENIHVDYFDSLVAADEVPDYVDEARIVCSASNEGLRTDTSTYPTSDEFTAHFTRPQAPTSVNDYALSVNTNQERCFLCFFPNPDNSSVTSIANILSYGCSLIVDSGIEAGGVLNSAFCYTDGSETENNCDAPFVSGSVTHIKLHFGYNPNVGDGYTHAEIEVIHDGQPIPKYISGVTVGKYWKPTSSSEIELWADRSGFKESVEVRKRQGINTVNNDGLQLESTVVAKTGDYTVLDSEAVGNRIFTNDGVSGKVVFDLPDAVAGRKITFICAEDQQMQIDAQSGDKIFLQNGVELDSVINSNKGRTLIMHCINSTEWICVNADSWTNAAGRGLFGAGNTGSQSDIIDYIEIPTTGNATDFGDLTIARYGVAGCSSATRGLFGGGFAGSTHYNTIDYVTIATPGNATDFGDLTLARRYFDACSNATRGLFGGGQNSTPRNVIDYVNMASTGNAIDFGDLTVARYGSGACANSTRAIFGGGYTGSISNIIDYVTIAITGNATDFGDLSVARQYMSGCSNATRGLFGGGDTGSYSNVIDYVTIASTGNATDFGDLTAARDTIAACSNPTRAIFGGGYTGSYSDILDYVGFDTIGNATDFGDLTAARRFPGACSDAHGGL